MNIREAFIRIKNQKEYKPTPVLWARPKHWKNSGCAIYIEPTTNVLKKTLNLYGRAIYTPSLRDLLDDWEVLSSAEIYKELE